MTPDRADPAVWCHGLTKLYGATRAVDQLSFTVPRGTVTGFLGPNGAGKTTTMRMLLGLCAPTSGQATVLGAPIGDGPAYLSRVGAMIETPAFYPSLSGRRNLEVLAALDGTPRSRVDEVLEVVTLTQRGGDRYATYSLGMKQRLGLAAALLSDPELLVLDEPTNGLDPAGIIEVRSLLRRLADAGHTVFMSSHLLAELEQLADRLVVIGEGRLLFEGTTAELIRRDEHLIARPERTGDLAKLARLVSEGGYAATKETGRLKIAAPGRYAADLNRGAAAVGITLVELFVERTSLETTFMEMTEDAARLQE